MDCAPIYGISGMQPLHVFFYVVSSRRRHTRYWRDWSSDVCSSDLVLLNLFVGVARNPGAQELVRLARHAAHGREHVKRRVRPLLEKQEQIITVQNQQAGIH